MSRNENRQLILQKGAMLVHRKGFHNSSINDIVQEAAVPKGSFYNYFKSKEDFAIAILEVYEIRFNEFIATSLLNNHLKPLKRLKVFLTDFEDHYKSINSSLGCPIGNLAEEISDINNNIRLKIVEKFNGLKNRIKNVLDEAQRQNELAREINTEEMSDFILNSWEGALLRMKAEKSIYPLKLLNKTLFKYLIK